MKKTLAIISLTLLSMAFFNVQADTAMSKDSDADYGIDLKFVILPSGQLIMGTTDLDTMLADLPEPNAAVIDAEWEYAARAAGLRPFSRANMGEYAWYISRANERGMGFSLA
jgi:hypothetical protein